MKIIYLLGIIANQQKILFSEIEDPEFVTKLTALIEKVAGIISTIGGSVLGIAAIVAAIIMGVSKDPQKKQTARGWLIGTLIAALAVIFGPDAIIWLIQQG